MNQDKTFKKTDEYYSYTRPEMLRFIPENSKKILDIGCGDGSFSSLMKKNLNAEVWGIEINQEAALIATNKIDKVLVGDIFETIKELPDSYFDCITCNDVLEHLLDPDTVLDKMKGKLSPTGVIVCSIPNIRHISVLKKYIIEGDWKYEDSGILDRTHLRFFTRKSIIRMLQNLNFEIIKIEGINGTKIWKFLLINILTLGFISDTRYVQFACVAKPK